MAVRVQQATPTQSAVSGRTLTISFAVTVPIGSFILVPVGYSGALGVTFTVSDAAGNTYQTDVNTDDGNSTGAYSGMASCKVTTALAAGQLITMTTSGAVTHRLMGAYELTGLDPTTRLAAAANTGKGTSTTPTSGTIHPIGANFAVYGICGYNAGVLSHSAGGAFTEINDVVNGSKGMAVDEQINVAAGAYQDAGTLSSSVLWSNSIVAYKSLAGSPVDSFGPCVSPTGYARGIGPF